LYSSSACRTAVMLSSDGVGAGVHADDLGTDIACQSTDGNRTGAASNSGTSAPLGDDGSHPELLPKVTNLGKVSHLTGVVRVMIAGRSRPGGRVPYAWPQSPSRRDAQHASATAGRYAGDQRPGGQQRPAARPHEPGRHPPRSCGCWRGSPVARRSPAAGPRPVHRRLAALRHRRPGRAAARGRDLVHATRAHHDRNAATAGRRARLPNERRW
jgi:hypothetical protein